MLSIINIILILCCLHWTILAKGFDEDGNKNSDKIRVCIVENKGKYKKVAKYCPILEQTSDIECVIGVDRSDCLRRIHKGSAHFSVFSSEDLVTARWAGVEILITNEMRFHDSPFDYEIVAIVDNNAGINTVQDLRGSRFCHPGHGLSNHWTDILANYFESTLVPRQCEEDLSLAESRIKATAEYFGPSCKAGPWVPDPLQDRILKRQYKSLCALCHNPMLCGVGDKHWGRNGPLNCITGGLGDVAWVRLDDVKLYFGFSGLQAEANPSFYSYLCPDGHLQPMNTTKPCIWIAKPWPSIGADRKSAEKVQHLLERLSHDEQSSWQNSLLSLLETHHVNVTSLDRTIPIDDYLDQATGFQSAYNFPPCNPPRSIVYCTTTLLQHYKCSWLQEASNVYGIEPNIQCVKTENLERCMDDTKDRVTDVVLIDQDNRIRAEKEYHLKPLLYEFSPEMHERYVVLAVVRANSKIYNFNDLYKKRACFPNFEGAAYISVLETLVNLSLIEKKCSATSNLENFFSKNSCLWSIESNKLCDSKYKSDMGALQCLFDDQGDVAFLSLDVFKNFTTNSLVSPWMGKYNPNDYKLLCPFGRSKEKDEFCYLHWTPRGHLMIHNGTTLMRHNEIYNSLRDMDKQFGKHYQGQNVAFTMFGPFERRNNVMFRDETDGLRGINELQKDRKERLLENAFTSYSMEICAKRKNSSNRVSSNQQLVIYTLFIITVIYSYS